MRFAVSVAAEFRQSCCTSSLSVCVCSGQSLGAAQVEATAPGEPGRPAFEVAFIDWGNTETVPASAVRPMGPALRAVEPQAAPASLAFLKARGRTGCALVMLGY